LPVGWGLCGLLLSLRLKNIGGSAPERLLGSARRVGVGLIKRLFEAYRKNGRRHLDGDSPGSIT
jgi:hypothetical protein